MSHNSEKSEESLPLFLLHMAPTVARDSDKSLIILGNASCKCKVTKKALENGNSKHAKNSAQHLL